MTSILRDMHMAINVLIFRLHDLQRSFVPAIYPQVSRHLIILTSNLGLLVYVASLCTVFHIILKVQCVSKQYNAAFLRLDVLHFQYVWVELWRWTFRLQGICCGQLLPLVRTLESEWRRSWTRGSWCRMLSLWSWLTTTLTNRSAARASYLTVFHEQSFRLKRFGIFFMWEFCWEASALGRVEVKRLKYGFRHLCSIF